MSDVGKVLGAIAGVCVLIAAVFLIGVYGFGWLQRSTADYRGKTSQIEKVHANGAYRIAQYDHFFDACASVQTLEAAINNSREELSTTTDPVRRQVINANITAQRNQRAAAIAQYNADASKSDTQANFLASSLPYQLDPNSEATKCAV